MNNLNLKRNWGYKEKHLCNLSSAGLYSGLVTAEEKGKDLEDCKRYSCLIQAERHSYA